MKILICLLCAPIVLFLAFALVSYLYSFTVDMSKFPEKQSRFACLSIAVIIPVFAWICGARTKVEGLDKMPKGKFLMVCNHRSIFDPVAVMAKMSWKYNLHFISKPENLHIHYVGKIAHAAGTLAIDRENNREALKTIIRAADYIKSGFCNMLIYPEGTRSKDNELLPFHAGSFKIAQRADCDLVIAAIDGSEKVKERLFRPNKVVITVLETIPAEKVKAMGTDELAEYSRNLIATHLSK